jgi:DNA uptake protein ComE-like DNA-binding protein
MNGVHDTVVSQLVGGETAAHKRDASFLIFSLLWLAIVPAWVSLPTGDAPSLPPIRRTVNPNTAQLWELTVLPRIGTTTAHRIIQYRQSAAPTPRNRDDPSIGNESPDSQDRRAFVRAADLLHVRGIGPQTLLRIGPYLDF